MKNQNRKKPLSYLFMTGGIKMSQETQSVKRPNNLIVESRKKMSVSGVKDVASFDDNTVMCADRPR